MARKRRQLWLWIVAALFWAPVARAMDAASALDLLKFGGKLTAGIEVGLASLQALARTYKERLQVRCDGMSFAEIEGILTSGAGLFLDDTLPSDQVRSLCTRAKSKVWVASRNQSFSSLMDYSRFGAIIYMDVDSTFTSADRQLIIRQGGGATVDSRLPMAVVRGMVELAPARVLVIARGFLPADLAILTKLGATVIVEAGTQIDAILAIAQGGAKRVVVIADSLPRPLQSDLAARGMHLFFKGAGSARPAQADDGRSTPVEQRPLVQTNSIFAPPPGSQATAPAAGMFAPPPETTPLRSETSIFAPAPGTLVERGGQPLAPPLTNTGGALPAEQGLGGGELAGPGLAPTLGLPLLGGARPVPAASGAPRAPR
jgi:hypothetical protein